MASALLSFTSLIYFHLLLCGFDFPSWLYNSSVWLCTHVNHCGLGKLSPWRLWYVAAWHVCICWLCTRLQCHPLLLSFLFETVRTAPVQGQPLPPDYGPPPYEAPQPGFLPPHVPGEGPMPMPMPPPPPGAADSLYMKRQHDKNDITLYLQVLFPLKFIHYSTLRTCT